MKLNELKNAIADLKTKMQEHGKEALKSAFAEVFEKHPKLESLTWCQYTPYFNDGDSCTFGVHEFDKAVYAGEEIEGPTYEPYDHEPSLPKNVQTAVKALCKNMQALEEVLLVVFNDHVEITATRNGFTVDEYSHD